LYPLVCEVTEVRCIDLVMATTETAVLRPINGLALSERLPRLVLYHFTMSQLCSVCVFSQ
jgi:hypothetical protein